LYAAKCKSPEAKEALRNVSTAFKALVEDLKKFEGDIHSLRQEKSRKYSEFAEV
jgi:hypothetical protein